MRLNEGQPVWHASVSLQRRSGRKIDDESSVEHYAVRALDSVGGDFEWWQWGDSLVGHLRVPVTLDELPLVPPGIVVMDAGFEGIRRERTRSGVQR